MSWPASAIITTSRSTTCDAPSWSIGRSIKGPSRSWLWSRQAGEDDERDYDGHDDGDGGEHVRCAQVPFRHDTGSPMWWCGRLRAVQLFTINHARPICPDRPLKALSSAATAHRIDDGPATARLLFELELAEPEANKIQVDRCPLENCRPNHQRAKQNKRLAAS